MPGGGMKGAVPAAVVLAVLSTISGLVTTLAGRGGQAQAEADLKYYVPRDELERRLGELELRLSAKLADLREVVIRRTGK